MEQKEENKSKIILRTSKLFSQVIDLMSRQKNLQGYRDLNIIEQLTQTDFRDTPPNM